MANLVLISEVWEYISRFKATHHYMSENRVATGTEGSHEFFQIDEWRCRQDKSIEQCKYYSPNPNRVIREIEYEGWRRHVETRRQNEGPRFIFHIRPEVNSLKTQANLARLIDDPEFRTMGGWLEPIRVDSEDPSLAVNFCEEMIQENSNYVDLLLHKVNLIETHETISPRIITDLKSVIAFNCVERFKQKLDIEHFEESFDSAVQLLRPCALSKVSSPYYIAALYCQSIHQPNHARQLVRYIPMSHWQYTMAIGFERDVYNRQINELETRNAHLEYENRKLKDRLMTMTIPDFLVGMTLNTGSSVLLPEVLANKAQPMTTTESRNLAKPIIFSKFNHSKLMDVFGGLTLDDPNPHEQKPLNRNAKQ